jgi:methionine-rich copper-binding protein CopC
MTSKQDTTEPTLVSASPTDNSSAVAVGSNIVLNFSENVAAGTGNIVISNSAGDTRTISITDASQVTLNLGQVTINPTADLLAGGSYNVQMASGVIKDLAGNAFAGIADATTLNFGTAGPDGVTERDTPFVVESYARSISSAVLFIDGDGNWKVGQVGQTVAQYKGVNADAAATVNDDTFELTALTAEARDGGGFLIYAQSNADPSSYSEITLDAAGLVTSQRALTLDQLFAAETKYGLDLNDNGGIGDQLVLADDGEADVYIDGAGAYVVKTPNGELVPLTLDSQPVTIYSLEDYEFSEVSIEADGSLTSYIEDESGSLFKMVSSSSGASSTPPQPVSAEDLAALEVKTGVDINRDYAKPLTEGWTASLKTASLRHDVEVQLAQSGKIGHAGLVNLLDGVLQSLQSSGATKVGADLVADLRALGARGQALFTSPDLAGNDTSYLSFVFDQMVNSSKANTTFTGGHAKSQSLGNLSADSAPSQLALLRDKWLLGKDLPNPATQGDTANPNAAAASGVYKTFTAELLVGDASLLDVNQGSAGTCYLMAALAGVANSSASALQTTFVSDGTVVGNRVWGVRFFDTQGKEVWVTANDQLAVAGPDATTALYARATGRDASGAVVPELWVPVVEKAYAQANELGTFARRNDANAMFAIEGGLADAVSNIVGGRMAWVNDQAYDTINGNPLLSAINAPAGSSIAAEVAKAINAGQIVWIGSDNETTDASGAILLTKGHAFLAFDPDPNNPNDTQIRVYNPWGFSAASSANPPNFVSPFLVDLSAVAGVAGYDFYVQVLGSNKDDVIFGTENGERLEVVEGNDVLRGLGGNDALVGGLGNDVLMGGPGNDSIDGGEGADKALFAGPRNSYTVSWSSSASAFTVVSSAEGTDTLIGIETLSFLDGSYSASSFQSNTLPADTTKPTLASASPTDNSSSVAVGSNIILTFSESVVARSGGTIELMTDYGSGHQSVEVFSVSDATRVTISGNVVTIDPTSALLPSTGYHLGFNNALADNAGNAFSYTHGQYNFTTAAANTAGKTADITAYSWKAHTLLSGVSLNAAGTSHSGTTDSNGAVSFTAVTDASLALTASRAIPSAEAAATSAAVNLQDAIAILKMIVGLDVNGAGKALSPYQALAADYDGNGSVQLTDAIGVLKHVVGLTAPDPGWRFVNELDATVPSKTTLSPGTAQTSITASLSASSPVKVGLVGYLTGDVDGSYGGGGSQSLDLAYFQRLGADTGLNLTQFGVYP